MSVMTIASLFLLFSVYGTLGWIIEVIFCSIAEKHYVNRGFLFGPFCPIYGLGGLLVVFILSPFRENYLLLFLASALATGLLEYATSYVLEKVFSASWWDYSKIKFNINGRVCPQSMIAFGALSVFTIRFLHPLIVRTISLVDSGAQENLALIIFVILAADFLLTLISHLHYNSIFSPNAMPLTGGMRKKPVGLNALLNMKTKSFLRHPAMPFRVWPMAIASRPRT